jgi:fatty acid desaturase
MKTRDSSTRFILTVCAALLDWLVIAAAIYVAELFDFLPLYAATIIIIASRQHALGVIAHEAIHWPKDRLQTVAIFTMKYLCAWPILMHFDAFREIHLAHHRYLNSDSDPDFVRNQPQDLYAADTLWRMLRYALGLNRRREKRQATWLKRHFANRYIYGHVLVRHHCLDVDVWVYAIISALLGLAAFHMVHFFCSPARYFRTHGNRTAGESTDAVYSG